MEFTAQQIADFIGGRVEGNEQAKVHTFAKIEEGKEGAITFCRIPNIPILFMKLRHQSSLLTKM